MAHRRHVFVVRVWQIESETAADDGARPRLRGSIHAIGGGAPPARHFKALADLPELIAELGDLELEDSPERRSN